MGNAARLKFQPLHADQYGMDRQQLTDRFTAVTTIAAHADVRPDWIGYARAIVDDELDLIAAESARYWYQRPAEDGGIPPRLLEALIRETWGKQRDEWGCDSME